MYFFLQKVLQSYIENNTSIHLVMEYIHFFIHTFLLQCIHSKCCNTYNFYRVSDLHGRILPKKEGDHGREGGVGEEYLLVGIVGAVLLGEDSERLMELVGKKWRRGCFLLSPLN